MTPGTGPGRRRKPPPRGIALVMVLWVSAILGLLGAGFLQLTRIESTRIAATEAAAAAHALIDAGLAYAVAGLRQPDPVRQWRGDGSAHEIRRGAARLTIRAWDERGRIDLNRAPEARLRDLFAALVPDQAVAARAAAAVIDRRTGRPGTFTDVAELATLPGIDPATARRLARATTVHNPRATVSAWTAPPDTLRGFPLLSDADRAAVLAQRGRSFYIFDPPLTRRLIEAGLDLAADPPAVATVRVGVETPDAHASAEAVLWLRPESGVAWRVLQWREPAPE